METFEELGLDSALLEALAAEGIEEPTALQRMAIPPLRRGTSAVLQGGPGAGLLVAYGIPLLGRLPGDAGHPAAIVLVPSRDRAEFLALSLARLATATSHRVGALGLPWARAERADILFTTMEDLETAVASSAVKLDGVDALILEGADALIHGAGAERLAAILSGVAAEEPQIVVVCDRATPAVRRWVEDHARKAVYLPPEAAKGESPEAPSTRGTVRVHVTEEGEDQAVPLLVSRLLSEGCGHVLVYSRSADQAADLGDVLALRGFAVGRPGDEAEIWLGVDPLETRDELAEGGIERAAFAVLSADPPPDPDSLDRRHGGDGPVGVVIVAPRGLPHLRRAAREAGYTLEPEPARDEAMDQAAEFRRTIEGALESEDLVPYMLLLEPLIQRHGSAAVAGALAALIRKAPGTSSAARLEPPARASAGTSGPPRPAAWSRLFLSVGKRDGIGTRDLLGAIIGESGIKGDQVGRIDLKDTFARVEVHDSVADRVIKALNGTSIRGRSVRADFDRGESRDQERAGAKTQGASRAGVRGKSGGPGKPGSRGEPGAARRRPRGPRAEE